MCSSNIITKNWRNFLRQFFISILVILLFSKTSSAYYNDTVVVSFAPGNCKNCLVDLAFIDSTLKSNNYIIKYYLFGLRKSEVNYYLSKKMLFIKSSQVINNQPYFDSLFRNHLTNLYFLKDKKIIELNEFERDLAVYCKIQFNESRFPLNNKGLFKIFTNQLLYIEGDVLNRLTLFSKFNGEMIKDIDWDNDSIVLHCYQQIYENQFDKAYEVRQKLTKEGLIKENEELILKNVEIHNGNIYVFLTLNVYQLNQNKFRPYDLMLIINRNYQLVDYYVSSYYLYNNEFASPQFSNINFSIQNDGRIIKPIYTIYPNEINKYEVLGLFKFSNHKITLDSVIKINSTFLEKKSPNSFFLLLFSNTFNFNGNNYFNCPTFPYIYKYGTGEEIKLFSKPEIEEMENYDEELKKWPFFVLKLEAVGDNLFVYTRESNIIILSVYDINFRKVKTIELDLLGYKLTNGDLIQIIRTEDNKIEYIVYTENESYYREKFIKLD